MFSIQIAKKIKFLFVKIYEHLKKTETMFEDMLNNPKRKRLTAKPQKYIHIGYPKAASTAIQKAYLGRHNQLLHLGCGNKTEKDFWDDHGYIDAEINKAMEIDLRYKTQFAYNEKETKEIFATYFKKAKKNKNIHAVGISNENFCFNWHGGIDISEKAKRLRDIFGSDTNIVIVLRQQKSLIESLYKENIRFGYAGSFADFLEYMWIYKDRNFTYEFCFENIIYLYSEYFGAENVHILFFEDLKLSPKIFLTSFSKAIGIDYYKLKFSKTFNKQLDSKELKIKRMLNDKYPHTLGKGKYEVIDNHRYIPYFTEELGIKLPKDIHIDHETRRYFNMLSIALRKKIEVPEIELCWNSEFGQHLLELYNSRNKELTSKMPELQSKFENFNYLTQ